VKQGKVYMVIVNWNGYEDTAELLESLFRISYRNYKIVVVDNNSGQDEAGKLQEMFGDKIHIISSVENLGFSGGNNIGIKKALGDNADYILLINNDTTVEPDFLDILVNKSESDERAGIVAPRINYYDEPGKIWTEGGKISRIRGSGFAYSDKLETEADSSDKSVTFVSGCCMLIRREVLLKVGLFDENYFLYTEDTDLCLRTIRAGYKIYVVPQSKIFHKVGSSTKNRNTALPLYYTTRNRLYFAKKHFNNTWFFTVLYIVVTMHLKFTWWLLSGKHKNIVVIKNAIRDFYSYSMGKADQKRFAG
jgi:GT2 family glycosyltransferase